MRAVAGITAAAVLVVTPVAIASASGHHGNITTDRGATYDATTGVLTVPAHTATEQAVLWVQAADGTQEPTPVRVVPIEGTTVQLGLLPARACRGQWDVRTVGPKGGTKNIAGHWFTVPGCGATSTTSTTSTSTTTSPTSGPTTPTTTETTTWPSTSTSTTSTVQTSGPTPSTSTTFTSTSTPTETTSPALPNPTPPLSSPSRPSSPSASPTLTCSGGQAASSSSTGSTTPSVSCALTPARSTPTLPKTGADDTLPILGAGLTALVLGVLLLIGRRRNR